MFQKVTYEAFDEAYSSDEATVEVQFIERNNSMGSIKSFQASILPTIAEAIVKRAADSGN